MLDAYVYDAVRTPRGRVRRNGGTLAVVPPQELTAQLLRELDRRLDLSKRSIHVDDVMLGVNTAIREQGANVAKVAAICAAWPDDVSGTVVSRLCCSGLDAISNAAARVSSGVDDVIVAGGVESMSREPMLSDEPAIALDEELADRTGFVTIAVSADFTAHLAGFERPELDDYAFRSHQRSAAAWANGHFARSVVPVHDADGAVLLASDEGIRAEMSLADFAAMPVLFASDAVAHDRIARRFPEVGDFVGLHSAASAPQLVDGASLAFIANAKARNAMGVAPRARIVACATASVRSPSLYGGVEAIRRVLRRANLLASDIDIVEANESFSVSPLLVQQEFGFSDEIVNVDGGAVAMGHPLGASGGILLATAMDALDRVDGHYALLAIPAALGLGTAIIIERLSA